MSRVAREALGRLPWLAFVIVGITLLTFVISNVIPADPARVAAGLQAHEDQVQIMRERMGLDRPLPEQYLRYLQRLAQGDLGQAASSSRPVADDLREYFPATLELVLAAIVPCTFLGVAFGTISATHAGRALDRVIQILSLIGMAMPRFWLAIVLQILFFGILGWFPSVGRLSLGVQPPRRITGLNLVDSLLTGDVHVFFDAAWHLVLPALALALGSIANIIRVTRVSVLDVLREDYVRTARAKGLRERAVLYKHVLRNAAVPILTVVGLQAGFMFSGAVLVEIVFGWPGIGKYAVDSIANLDFAPIMGVTLVVAVVFVIINLCVDLLYLMVDPRIRF